MLCYGISEQVYNDTMVNYETSMVYNEVVDWEVH